MRRPPPRPMKIQVHSKSASRVPVPLLVVLGFEGEKPPGVQNLGIPKTALTDFKGKFRQVVMAYPHPKRKIDRVALVGLGKREKVGPEEVRRVSALAYNTAKDRGIEKVAIEFPEDLTKTVDGEALGRAIAEGMLLGSYKFDKYKGKGSGVKDEKKPKGPSLAIVLTDGDALAEGTARGMRRALAANFARALEDSPANFATPTDLAKAALELVGDRVECTVLEADDMTRLGMGALLGVAQGSAQAPKLIVLHYKPKAKAKQKIALVGKGLTFDSGGISIKPSAAMDEMKFDMCGGGAVLGTFHALRNMDLPLEVIGLVPATENLPDGKAYKPGDVLTACDGTTIEVINTDAEGRLILCDAIAHAEKHYKPDVIVDLATLTGAVVVALGHEMTGVFANDAELQKVIVDAGERAGERCWPMPLWDVHRDQVKSDIADLKNINSPKDGGGSIAGAAFLAHFVKKAKWAHLDIAGTAWGGRERDYLHATGASGVGVRLLLEFLETRARA